MLGLGLETVVRNMRDVTHHWFSGGQVSLFILSDSAFTPAFSSPHVLGCTFLLFCSYGSDTCRTILHAKSAHHSENNLFPALNFCVFNELEVCR